MDVVNHARAHYPQLSILLISGQDLRPAHNPALPDVALLRKPLLGESWRRRCGIRVIEIPPLPAQIRFDYRGASFLMRLVLCNAPRHSFFLVC